MMLWMTSLLLLLPAFAAAAGDANELFELAAGIGVMTKPLATKHDFTVADIKTCPLTDINEWAKKEFAPYLPALKAEVLKRDVGDIKCGGDLLEEIVGGLLEYMESKVPSKPTITAAATKAEATKAEATTAAAKKAEATTEDPCIDTCASEYMDCRAGQCIDLNPKECSTMCNKVQAGCLKKCRASKTEATTPTATKAEATKAEATTEDPCIDTCAKAAMNCPAEECNDLSEGQCETHCSQAGPRCLKKCRGSKTKATTAAATKAEATKAEATAAATTAKATSPAGPTCQQKCDAKQAQCEEGCKASTDPYCVMGCQQENSTGCSAYC